MLDWYQKSSFHKRQFLFILQDVLAKIQKLWSNKYIHAFWVFNGILRLKLTVSGREHVITHSHDLDELFTVRAFTEKFHRSINSFLQVALNFLLLVLIVDSFLQVALYFLLLVFIVDSFLQVALYFLLLVLIVDSYFALFIRLCFSAKECAH